MTLGPSSVLDDHLVGLGLPAAMATRTPSQTNAVMVISTEVDAQIDQRNRRFVPGLVMAFIAMAEAALDRLSQTSMDDVLEECEYETVNARGQRVNTLNLFVDDGDPVRLRPYYGAAEHVFVHDLRRYDYPNMAPHATQAWPQHEDLLRGIFALHPDERRALAERVIERVLLLPEYGRRSTEDASPRPFETVLKAFAGTQKGEPPGAILQGLAFAYYRADSPNVTIETGKVGASSRRTGRIGDVDGWSGADLVLSIEVKDEDLTDAEDATLDSFIANLAEWPDATAIVVARSADDDVTEALAEQNVAMLTRENMRHSVIRWDLNKQRLAAREMHYFLVRVQRHSGLIARYEQFLEDNAVKL